MSDDGYNGMSSTSSQGSGSGGAAERAAVKAHRDASFAWLRDFYVDRVADYFDGHVQHGQGRCLLRGVDGPAYRAGVVLSVVVVVVVVRAEYTDPAWTRSCRSHPPCRGDGTDPIGHCYGMETIDEDGTRGGSRVVASLHDGEEDEEQ